jgi:hypothetical protein
MADITRVAGVKQVINNLRAADKRFDAGISRGLKKGGLWIQRQSQLQVPVDKGFLKASAFTRAVGRGYNTRVQVGYTASYALSVHEKVAMKLRGLPRDSSHLNEKVVIDEKGKLRGEQSGQFVKAGNRGRYWDPIPRAKAKFLEDPFLDEAPTVRKIVIEEARKGLL